MKVVISTSGPYHLFETAKQLQDRQYLSEIFTAYPLFKLNKWGVDMGKIHSFPYIYSLWILYNRATNRIAAVDSFWDWLTRLSHDQYCRHMMSTCDIFIGLSSFSLLSGQFARNQFGAIYICERGSTHVSHQERVMRKEYESLGLRHQSQSRISIQRELDEYDAADYVSIPSSIVRKSFVDNGVPVTKLIVHPYGINTTYFKPTKAKSDTFKIVFVGALSVRKGLHKLIMAANILSNENITISVIGSPTVDTPFLKSLSNSSLIRWVGHLPWERLVDELSSAHAMVLPSIEEGLAIVQGQALACGCPVIASRATGAEDLFKHGMHGIILDECTPEAIASAIMELYNDRTLCNIMSIASSELALQLGGWESYGERVSKQLLTLLEERGRGGSSVGYLETNRVNG